MQILPRGLNGRLILLVSCILFATGVTGGWYTASQQSDMLIASMREHAAVMVRNFSDRSAYFLVLEDFAGLESFLLKSVDLPDIMRLQVCEADGQIVGEVGDSPDEKPKAGPEAIRLVPPASQSATSTIQGDELLVWQPIEAGDLLGWTKATYSLSSIRKAQADTLKNSILLSLFWGSCSVGLLLVMLRPLVQSISTLTQFARNLNSHKGEQVDIEFPVAEIEELGSSLNYASTKLYASEQELIRGQATLQEQYSTLRGILESTDAMIYSVDRQYRYTSFNTAYASQIRAISGMDVQLKESLLDYIIVAEDREETTQNLNRALAGEAHVTETFLDDLASSRRYFEVFHNPITVGETGEVIGVTVYARDITERKKTEEAMRQLNDGLEQRVTDRTSELEKKNAELERINELFVGRELRMVELKERIRKLEKKLSS